MSTPKQERPKDEAFEVLAMHDWDALEAVRTVLAERDAIEERLRMAAIAMGRGYTRGWKPQAVDLINEYAGRIVSDRFAQRDFSAEL